MLDHFLFSPISLLIQKSSLSFSFKNKLLSFHHHHHQQFRLLCFFHSFFLLSFTCLFIYLESPPTSGLWSIASSRKWTHSFFHVHSFFFLFILLLLHLLHYNHFFLAISFDFVIYCFFFFSSSSLPRLFFYEQTFLYK